MQSPPMIVWAEAFADRVLELHDGRADIHDLIDWGYRLWPEQGHRPAVEVATEQVAKQRPLH